MIRVISWFDIRYYWMGNLCRGEASEEFDVFEYRYGEDDH